MDNQYAEVLKSLEPEHDFLVCIDSDGCAFDTMEIKHKECFIPNIIKHWKLQPVSRYAREAAEFVNLYSRWRGINRFPALVMVFDLLKEREGVQKRSVSIPQAEKIREFIDSGLPLGNPGLQKMLKNNPDPELELTLKWSKAVNKTVADIVEGVPPFPLVEDSLKRLQNEADMVVVSSTPLEALEREWEEHGIAEYTRAIAGQEMGPKSDNIADSNQGAYADNHILMIGDAPGDMNAARENNALFYPIIPGKEEASWEKFYQEAVDLFLNEEYRGSYEDSLVDEFLSYLPERPPWK